MRKTFVTSSIAAAIVCGTLLIAPSAFAHGGLTRRCDPVWSAAKEKDAQPARKPGCEQLDEKDFEGLPGADKAKKSEREIEARAGFML